MNSTIKRAMPLILPVFFSIFACSDSKDKSETATVSEPATTTKNIEANNAVTILDIKIPESSDAELNEFFKSYTAHLNEYVVAVRENNQPGIKASFAKERKFKIQLLDMPARLHKTVPGEWEKYETYRSRTAKYVNEIERSEYVKDLYDKALKS
jgi:hypothetical protein